MEPAETQLISISVIKRFLLLIFLLHVLFLGGTGFVHSIYTTQNDFDTTINSPTLAYLINALNLGNENNLAAWYSSIVLMCVALFTITCFHLDDSPAQSILRYGWIGLTLIFVLLSFDELGSLHENAGKITSLDILGDKSWESVIIVPGILILLFMGLFAWHKLRHQYAVIFFLLTGCLLYISVPIQEHIEISLFELNQNIENWRRPALHVVLEEGAELFGSFCFLMAFYIFIKKQTLSNQTKIIVCKTSLIVRLLTFLLGIGIILFVGLYVFQQQITSTDGGNTFNWPASMLSFLLAWLSYIYFRKLALFSFFILLSMYIGTNFYTLIYWEDILALTLITESGLFAGLIAFGIYFHRSITSTKNKFLFYSAALLLSISFISTSFYISTCVYFLLLLLFIPAIQTKENATIEISAA